MVLKTIWLLGQWFSVLATKPLTDQSIVGKLHVFCFPLFLKMLACKVTLNCDV